MILFLGNLTLPTVLTPSPAPVPSLPSGPQQLLLCKLASPITHLESTLLQVFFLKNLKPFGMNTYEKQGEGWVIMVNHLLETSHPFSSLALPFCVSAASPSSILRTLFRVPYPVNPLLTTLTKTPGVWGYSSHFRTLPSADSKFQGGGALPYLFTSLPRCFLPSSPSPHVARWTDGRRQAIISSQQHWREWQLFQRRK
jgi:hypothetical protein